MSNNGRLFGAGLRDQQSVKRIGMVHGWLLDEPGVRDADGELCATGAQDPLDIVVVGELDLPERAAIAIMAQAA